MRASPLLPLLGALLLAGCLATGPDFDPYPTNGPTTKGAAVPASFQPLAPGPKIPPEDLKPDPAPFRLGVGDRIEIEILDEPNTRQVALVCPDGMLYYEMLAGIKVTGMTLDDLKKAIEDKLKEMYRAPQISLTLRDVSSQRVWVLGRVNTPGLYPLTGPMTVLEAISKAGGLFTSRFSGTTEELADLKHSFIVRDGNFLPVNFYALLHDGDLSQNIYLKDGDYIYLPSSLSQEVYVLGAVLQPKAIGFSDQITIVSAIAGAKGLGPHAYAQSILIVRGSLTDPKVAVVNWYDIVTGKAPNIALEPHDIIWVPNAPWERLEEYGRLVINSFVRTVAANEGIHAASPSAQPIQPGVNINVGN